MISGLMRLYLIGIQTRVASWVHRIQDVLSYSRNETVITPAVDQYIEKYPRGYPRLAALQNSDPVFSIFRRFGVLHTRTLLLAQEELCNLEERLQNVDDAERTQLFLSSRVYDENEERQSLLAEIRLKLRAYDDDLMRFLRLSASTVPRKGDVQSFLRWMDAVKPLIEKETAFLKRTDDFVTVNRDTEDGFLEEAVESLARRSGFGNNFLKSQREHRISTDPDLHFYSVERRGLVVRLMLTGLASCLLLIPTLLLYIIADNMARFLVIALFTFLFASALAVLTQAKRHEIFASTAAFSAVLVVFVSNIDVPSP